MEKEGNKTEKKTRINRTKAIINPTEIGKIPPQAIDLEKAVLGAIMLDNNALNDIIDVLRTKDVFYDPKHQLIFEAIAELYQNSMPVDILTVSDQLRKMGSLEIAGGAYYLSTLTNRIASAAHIEFHSRILVEKYIQREIISISNEILRDAYDETHDVFEVLSKAEEGLFEIVQNNMKKSYDSIQNTMRDAMMEIESARKNTDGISGIPTGLKDLDRMTSGWQRSDMIVIAARPSMGKTAFVLSMARNMAVDYNIPVAIFSLEMPSTQLVKRLIASEAKIPAEKLRKGDIKDYEMQQIHSKIDRLSKAPIYIDDTPGISIFELRAKCRRLKQKHNIEAVIIDYLQLMSSPNNKFGGNREQEISTISRSIKEIAKELNIPVLVLSQLNRSVETRGGAKKPILSDLRESGAIEQDADIVAFIYRPEFYGFDQDENGNPTEGIGEILISKHRNGATGTVQLRFIGQYARFENLDDFDNSYDKKIPAVALESGETQTMENYIIKSSRMNNEFEDDYDFSDNDNDIHSLDF